MSVIAVDDLEDPRLAIYRDLNKANLWRGSGRFIAEGKLLVERLLASEYAVESILAEERALAELPAPPPESVQVYLASKRQIRDLVGFKFHRGILACGRRREIPDLTAAQVGSLVDASPRGAALGLATWIVCPQIQDPENLGGILRCGAAFGAAGVVLGARCADPFSRRVLRVSMGAVFKLPLFESADLASDLGLLRACGVRLAATVLDGAAERLDQCSRPPRLALLFGEEGYGLPPDTLDLCDQRLTLPMERGTDSLNVAVASGVFLYQLVRLAPIRSHEANAGAATARTAPSQS